MAASILLGVGDGATSDSLDLLNSTAYIVQEFHAPWTEGATRLVTLSLTILGTSA